LVVGVTSIVVVTVVVSSPSPKSVDRSVAELDSAEAVTVTVESAGLVNVKASDSGGIVADRTVLVLVVTRVLDPLEDGDTGTVVVVWAEAKADNMDNH
jgi:hypothetical protein